MVKIFYNIVTILSIFTIFCINIVIIYGNNIVEIDNMMDNIFHHIVKFDNIVDNIVTLCRPYCE